MLILWGFTNFQERGVTKKQNIWGINKKGGLGQFAEGLGKKQGGGAFEGGGGGSYLDAHYDLILVYAET